MQVVPLSFTCHADGHVCFDDLRILKSCPWFRYFLAAKSVLLQSARISFKTTNRWNKYH